MTKRSSEDSNAEMMKYEDNPFRELFKENGRMRCCTMEFILLLVDKRGLKEIVGQINDILTEMTK